MARPKQDMYGLVADTSEWQSHVPHRPSRDTDPWRPHEMVGNKDWMLGTERPMHEPEMRDPKGYRRSDETILDEVCIMLSTHDEIDVSNIEVEVNSGEVTLKGTIPEKWMKRLAEDLAACVLGVVDVHNEIRVKGSLKEQLLGDPRDRPPKPGSVSRAAAAPVPFGHRR